MQDGEGSAELKAEIRDMVWRILEERGVSRPPKPIHGRIPNFAGSELACETVSGLPEFRQARVVKINPDSPQTRARYLSLRAGKLVIMPTPRLREGFLILDPRSIPVSKISEASTIRGSFVWGLKASIDEIPKVDLVIVGSVAVNKMGARLGKGGGYADLEYGVLRELGLVTEDTPVITTVHDLQIINREIPMEKHDLPVDLIITPTRVVEVEKAYRKPIGIYWDRIDRNKFREIPLLAEILKRKGRR
ncbi:MAG: 5-formyltetrahydrofolate cyclo-ligase [Desulfurococcales archaeon]|jgi:5-formyltetrahydrofolate cyclo-ligase|nr:5-formyltetrahydrofolate cyclo-ligase [Desulfurococcales archaeon]